MKRAGEGSPNSYKSSGYAINVGHQLLPLRIILHLLFLYDFTYLGFDRGVVIRPAGSHLHFCQFPILLSIDLNVVDRLDFCEELPKRLELGVQIFVFLFHLPISFLIPQ